MIDGSRACVISATAPALPAAPSLHEYRSASGVHRHYAKADLPDVTLLTVGRVQSGLRFREVTRP
jgi:hypothetical protein